MRVIMNSRSARIGLASLLGALATFAGAASANAAETGCNPQSLTCTTGNAALAGNIRTKLGTEIDSGWMDKGKIKVRTRFTIDPVKGEPLLTVDMPTGAVVEASWPEKGNITLKPITAEGAQGTMNVKYTLTPSLEASIYGINVAYNADQLLAKIPGSSFNYEGKTTGQFAPWGFGGGQAVSTAKPLDQSTLFALPFSDLGIDPGFVDGTLSIQAVAKPTFKYTTKEVQFDSGSVSAADGSAKIPAGDADFLDVSANIVGELALAGELDIRPVVKVDSVEGIPTFGLVKFSFSAVTKQFGGGAATPVQFERATIHIPLPNVKVPNRAVGIGTAKAGGKAEKTISIDSTGEMDAILKFESSDPQFVVPQGEVRVKAKSKYDLAVQFKANSDAPASATITVRSNDPDSPDQTFKVGANGADLSDEDDPSGSGRGSKGEPVASDGCSLGGGVGVGLSSSSYAAFGLGLVAMGIAARRRRAAR